MPLRLRDRVGLNVPPLLLRFMLGTVFVWAGLGKVSEMIEVSGEPAAILANMGVIAPAAAPGAGPAPKVEPPAPAKPPESKPPESKQPETKPPEPKAPATKPGGTAGRPGPSGSAGIALVRRQSAPRQYTAADFPSPVHVRRLYGLALLLHSAAAPDGGAGTMPLWPPSLAAGSAPVYLAWSVASTELAGGVFLLLGLLTRLAALGVAGVMMGAIWLTEIGPAIQSGKTVLGFLPQRPAFGPDWQTLLLQFALCMAALALAFCGPGRLSLDTALLSGRGDDDDED